MRRFGWMAGAMAISTGAGLLIAATTARPGLILRDSAVACAARETTAAEACGLARELSSTTEISGAYIASVVGPMLVAGRDLAFDPNVSETAMAAVEQTSSAPKVPVFTNPGAIVPPVEDINMRAVELTLGTMNSSNQ